MLAEERDFGSVTRAAHAEFVLGRVALKPELVQRIAVVSGQSLEPFRRRQRIVDEKRGDGPHVDRRVDPNQRLQSALRDIEVLAGRLERAPGLVHAHLDEQPVGFVDHAARLELQRVAVMSLERAQRLLPDLNHAHAQPQPEIALDEQRLHLGPDLSPVYLGDLDHRPADPAGIDSFSPGEHRPGHVRVDRRHILRSQREAKGIGADMVQKARNDLVVGQDRVDEILGRIGEPAQRLLDLDPVGHVQIGSRHADGRVPERAHAPVLSPGPIDRPVGDLQAQVLLAEPFHGLSETQLDLPAPTARRPVNEPESHAATYDVLQHFKRLLSFTVRPGHPRRRPRFPGTERERPGRNPSGSNN